LLSKPTIGIWTPSAMEWRAEGRGWAGECGIHRTCLLVLVCFCLRCCCLPAANCR